MSCLKAIKIHLKKNIIEFINDFEMSRHIFCYDFFYQLIFLLSRPITERMITKTSVLATTKNRFSSFNLNVT